METVIVICLLIIIGLLVQDKIVPRKMARRKPELDKGNSVLPDIMGKPKLVRGLSEPNRPYECQKVVADINTDNLDIEYDKNEHVGIQIPQEELDEVFSNMPDFEEEEEEWNRYGISSDENGFAQGVTFEELSAVGMLLQKDRLEPSQKETAVSIVQKIQGTELFSLLENSMESASLKIAELLDGSFSSEIDAGSSTLRKNNLEDFDIGEFV